MLYAERTPFIFALYQTKLSKLSKEFENYQVGGLVFKNGETPPKKTLFYEYPVTK